MSTAGLRAGAGGREGGVDGEGNWGINVPIYFQVAKKIRVDVPPGVSPPPGGVGGGSAKSLILRGKNEHWTRPALSGIIRTWGDGNGPPRPAGNAGVKPAALDLL